MLRDAVVALVKGVLILSVTGLVVGLVCLALWGFFWLGLVWALFVLVVLVTVVAAVDWTTGKWLS